MSNGAYLKTRHPGKDGRSHRPLAGEKSYTASFSRECPWPASMIALIPASWFPVRSAGKPPIFSFRILECEPKALAGPDHIRRHVRLSLAVRCDGCHAMAGEATFHGRYSCDTPPLELLPAHIALSQQAAILNWNMRAPIRERAYELVNKLIASAIKAGDTA